MGYGNNVIFVSTMPAKQHDSIIAISTSFSPGQSSHSSGTPRHFFSPFSNPPSCGASIGDAPRFMGVMIL